MRIRSFLGAVVGGVAALTIGGAASAEKIVIKTAGMYNPATVKLKGPGLTENVYSSAVKFEITSSESALASLVTTYGFCVDIFHNITVGIGSQRNMNLKYHTSTLTTDANGKTLSASQIQQISGLASLGRKIAFSSAPDRDRNLAAIQGAIWAIEYPAFSVTPVSGFTNLQSTINQYVAQAPTLTGGAYTFYADDRKTQGFVSGVPEAATWMQMIAGFGLLGMVARRRRANAGSRVLA